MKAALFALFSLLTVEALVKLLNFNLECVFILLALSEEIHSALIPVALDGGEKRFLTRYFLCSTHIFKETCRLLRS